MSRIVIADDDPDIRDLCFTILSTEGFEVLVAENAPECIKLAHKDRPDLILLDWMMPGVDGMEALQLLKSNAATAEIPVVMVTAYGGPMEITLATHHGAEGYVTKPFEPADLLSLVQRFTAAPPSLPPFPPTAEADAAGPAAGA